MTELSPAPLVHDTRIVFRNGETPILGTIWLPSLIPLGRGHPAIVLAATGVDARVQAGTDYARRLAAQGYVALAFDPSRPGPGAEIRSGSPRSATRGDDIGCALDFLSALPVVDPTRMGVLGIGAGGYAVACASTDRRIRATAIVAPTGLGEASPTAVDHGVRPLLIVGAQDVSGGLADGAEADVASGPRAPATSAVFSRASRPDTDGGPHPIERIVAQLTVFYSEWLVP